MNRSTPMSGSYAILEEASALIQGAREAVERSRALLDRTRALLHRGGDAAADAETSTHTTAGPGQTPAHGKG